MKKTLVMMLGFALLTGCAATKIPVNAIGGSKADGTVRMVYSYGLLVKPSVDLIEAQNIAAKRCKVWGYTGAEAFGGQVTNCARMGPYGCEQTDVSIEYQCTGGQAASN